MIFWKSLWGKNATFPLTPWNSSFKALPLRCHWDLEFICRITLINLQPPSYPPFLPHLKQNVQVFCSPQQSVIWEPTEFAWKQAFSILRPATEVWSLSFIYKKGFSLFLKISCVNISWGTSAEKYFAAKLIFLDILHFKLSMLNKLSV